MKQAWEVKRLGDVVKTGAGGTPRKSHEEYYEGGTIPWLLSGEVSQGLIYKSKNFITTKGLENSSAKLFPINTVLVAMYGATVGQVGILKCEATTNQAVCGILPNDVLSPEFLYYFFLSKKDDFIAQAVGNAQPNISQIKIKNTEIPVPPLETQKQIVAVLDKAFAAIDLAKANIEKNLQNAKELFQSKLNQIFTQKGEDWEEKSLDEVCQIKPPKKEAKKLLSANDLVSFVPMKSLGIGEQYFVPNEERTLGKVSGSYTYFKDADVLLAKITPCFENGKLGIARGLKNGIGFGSSEFIVYRTKGELLPGFLYHFLNQSSFRNTGASQMTGAVGHKRIPKHFYEKAYIPLPPKDEQEKIIKNLDTLRLEVQKLEKHELKRLLDLDELKKSILQKAFLGELIK